MDFIGPGKGNYLLSKIYLFSRLLRINVCEEGSGREDFKGLQCWIEVHSPSQWLVTDQGRHFKHRVVEKWCVEHEIEHAFIVESGHHTNRLVERANLSIVDMLRKELDENPRMFLYEDVPKVVKISILVIMRILVEFLVRYGMGPNKCYVR